MANTGERTGSHARCREWCGCIGIRTAQAELRVAQRNVEIERRGYMIAKRRAEEGAVTEVDPAQAAAALIFTRADAPVLAPGF